MAAHRVEGACAQGCGGHGPEGHRPEVFPNHKPHEEATQEEFLHDRHHHHEPQPPQGDVGPRGVRVGPKVLKRVKPHAAGVARDPLAVPLEFREHHPGHRQRHAQQRGPPGGPAQPAPQRRPGPPEQQERGRHAHGIHRRIEAVGDAEHPGQSPAILRGLKQAQEEKRHHRHQARPPGVARSVVDRRGGRRVRLLGRRAVSGSVGHRLEGPGARNSGRNVPSVPFFKPGVYSLCRVSKGRASTSPPGGPFSHRISPKNVYPWT